MYTNLFSPLKIYNLILQALQNKTGEINSLLESRSIDSLKLINSSSNQLNVDKLNKVNTRVDALDNQFTTLDNKFRFFGANLTEQLQRQEERASQSWVTFLQYIYDKLYFLNGQIIQVINDNIILLFFQKLIGDLQDDIQNVSAKVYSDEMRFKETQSNLSRLQKQFLDFSQSTPKIDSKDSKKKKEGQ